MTITPELLLLVGSVLFFISMLLGKAGHRFGVPVLLLFLTLGLLVNPSEWINLLVPALIISAFLMFLGRPLAVFLSLSLFRKIGFKDKLYVSWVGLRGAEEDLLQHRNIRFLLS